PLRPASAASVTRLPVCVPYETLNLIWTPLPSGGVKDLTSDSPETTPHRLCCVRNPLPVCVPYETLNLIGTPLPNLGWEFCFVSPFRCQVRKAEALQKPRQTGAPDR